MTRSRSELEQKYNRAAACIGDMKDQLDNTQKILDETISEKKQIEKAVRSFCETVLKQKREIPQEDSRSGKEKVQAWFQTSTIDMIKEATEAYGAYFDEQKEHVKQLLELFKERGKQLEVQRKELEDLRKNGASKKEIEEIEKKHKEGLMRYEEANAELSGILEQAADAPKEEAEIMDQLQQMEENMQKKNEKFPVSENAEKVKRRKDAAEKKAAATKEKAEGIKIKLNSIQVKVIKAIGETGFSEFKQIYDHISDHSLTENESITESKIRLSLTCLADEYDILEKYRIKNITKGNKFVYTLTPTGKKVYEQLAKGRKPVTSEVETIKSEHDNVIHGYGIVQTAQLIETSEFIKDRADVIWKTRKMGIPVGDKLSFIPDIIIDFRGARDNIYIEYETTKCTQEAFNAKCEKYLKVTPNMYFIVPNKEALDEICGEIDKWIEKEKKEHGMSRKYLFSVATTNTLAVSITSGMKNKLSDWDYQKKNIPKKKEGKS